MHMAATLYKVQSMNFQFDGFPMAGKTGAFGGYTSARKVKHHCLSESKLARVVGRRQHQTLDGLLSLLRSLESSYFISQ